MNLKTGLMLLGLIITLIGVIGIFDARTISKKLFSFGDQNSAVATLKIVGFIVAIIGAIIVFCNK